MFWGVFHTDSTLPADKIQGSVSWSVSTVCFGDVSEVCFAKVELPSLTWSWPPQNNTNLIYLVILKRENVRNNYALIILVGCCLSRPSNYGCFLEASYLTSQQKPAVNGAGILLIIHYQLPNCQKINAKPRCHWDTFSWKFRRPYPARKSGHFYVVPRWCPGRCLLPPVLAPKLMPDWPYNSQWWPRRRRWRPGWRSADRNVLGFREKKKDGNLWENQLNTTPWILQETEGLSPKRSWNLGTSQSWLFLRGVI